jgi:hypothetical protein
MRKFACAVVAIIAMGACATMAQASGADAARDQGTTVTIGQLAGANATTMIAESTLNAQIARGVKTTGNGDCDKKRHEDWDKHRCDKDRHDCDWKHHEDWDKHRGDCDKKHDDDCDKKHHEDCDKDHDYDKDHEHHDDWNKHRD